MILVTANTIFYGNRWSKITFEDFLKSYCRRVNNCSIPPNPRWVGIYRPIHGPLNGPLYMGSIYSNNFHYPFVSTILLLILFLWVLTNSSSPGFQFHPGSKASGNTLFAWYII